MFAKVVLLHLSVSHSVRMGGLHPEGACIKRVSASRGCLHLRGGGRQQSPPHRILRDTVNEWAVRILLEFILVF